MEKEDIIVAIILSICALADLRWHALPEKLLWMGIAAAIGKQLLCQKEDMVSILAAIGVAAIFFLMSYLTKEAIGYGDSMGILALAIYLGFWKLLEVLSMSLFFLAIGSILLLTFRKMSKKAAIPLYPFLSMGFITGCLLN